MKKVLGCLVLVLSASTTSAEECSWYEILCAAAQKAGEKAAVEIRAGMIDSTDIAFSAINYWPWLIQKYHTGTPEEKARAKELVAKVFGASSIENAQPFEVTFSFEGIDTTRNKLDLIVLRDYAKPDLKTKIKAGNTVDFNPFQVIGTPPGTKENYEQYLLDVESVRAKVRADLNAALPAIQWSGVVLRGEGEDPQTVCKGLSEPALYGRRQPCSDFVEWRAAAQAFPRLIDALMADVDRKVDKLAHRPKVTIPYEGYNFLTVVIDQEQLKAQPDLKLSYHIHVKGKPDSPIPLFTQPWTISAKTLLEYPVYASSRREHTGKYYGYTMDLGLSNLMPGN